MTIERTKTKTRVPRAVGILLASVPVVIAALLVTVLAVGGLFAPATYLEPWDEEYADTFEDPRMKLVAQAVLAPSSHNEQPWTVVLDPADDDVLYLYADPTRLTPEVDPLARQTMISQGAFLEYLVVAGETGGIQVEVELFPDGGYDEAELEASMRALPVAKLTLRPLSAHRQSDHASIFLSDTNRGPYTSEGVTSQQANELETLITATVSGSGSGTDLTVLRGQDDVAAISAATVRGAVVEAANPAVAAESAALFRSNEFSKNENRSGFAVEGQGTHGFMKYLLQGVTTLLPETNSPQAAASRDVTLATEGAAHTPAYAMLVSAGNGRTDQVEAGMLYARFALRARSLGLVAQPVSQVLEEYPTMQAERDSIHHSYAPGGGTIQMLARLGTATVDYPPTMRRDASDLVGVASRADAAR